MIAAQPRQTGKPRDLSRIGWLDYLLMTIGSCLAGYSGGMAIGEPSISWFVVEWTVVGSLISYLIRRFFIGSPMLKVDGILYGLVVVVSFIFRMDLQRLMPLGGFPFEVLAAGWLCWMLILGSFCTWQDSTLLFQAVPSIAIFGLVGCYDTFKGVIFLFFAFLLCLATLFARAHYRVMLKQAADSGYFTRGLAPGAPVPEVETTPGLAQKMEEGPWRWVAGPEWALGSAFVVVLVSLMGAPVIRQSTQGVSGFVHIPQPNVRPRPPVGSPGSQASATGEMRIGRGQNRVTDTPMFEITMPALYYLRSNTYDTYANRTWRFSYLRQLTTPGNASETSGESLRAMQNSPYPPRRVPFSIHLRAPLATLALPGQVIEWGTDQNPMGGEQTDGSYSVGPTAGRTEFSGVSLVASESAVPRDADRDLPGAFQNMLNLENMDPKVLQLGREVAGGGTDFERANRIMREIGSRIKYNLNVAATPDGVDPVEFALFEKQEAYCDIFASAMVQMSRAAGIPARLAVGYLPSPEAYQGNRYLVLEKDYHAWAELYFQNIGWVIFDPTSLAEAVPGGERGAASDNSPWYQKPWFKSLLDSLMVIFAGVALLFGYRAVQGMQKERTTESDLHKAYLGFVRLMERSAGRRRNLSETPDEFFRGASASMGAVQAKAEELNDQFVAALYAKAGIQNEEVERLRGKVRELKREIADAKRKKG